VPAAPPTTDIAMPNVMANAFIIVVNTNTVLLEILDLSVGKSQCAAGEPFKCTNFDTPILHCTINTCIAQGGRAGKKCK